jgi:hypothetical protein
LGTDSKSVLTAIPSFCGPIAYSIVEGYSFVSLSSLSNPGTISIQTNKLSDAGVYTATFDALLTTYPTVAHAEIVFTITIIDPCLTTMLALPTALAPVTIVAMSGIGSSALFAPATDTAGTAAATPGLCGPRLYSIVEVPFQSFVTIVPASGSDPYVNNWSLAFQSY